MGVGGGTYSIYLSIGIKKSMEMMVITSAKDKDKNT